MKIFAIDKNVPMMYDIIKDNSPKNIIKQFENGNINNKELINSKTQFLIARSTLKINQELLENSNVKVIATATTGTDHIDINYLNENNIKLFAATGANSNSVAEYVIFSILFFLKNNPNSIQNKTIGIIGFGNIGTKVAKYLNKMNANILVYDPFVCNVKKNQNNLQIPNTNIQFCHIDKIINQSDIITLHIPLTENGKFPTKNIINKEKIQNIKDNTLIINAARGNICDENELIKHKNRLNFVIDVWNNEPIHINSELMHNSLIATPHIAGHSYNGKINATIMICKFLNNQYNFNINLENILNKNENIQNKNENSQNKNENIQNKNENLLNNPQNLLNILTKNRNIIETSNCMKITSDIKSFFINTRKSYPQYFETLIPNLFPLFQNKTQFSPNKI